MGASSKAAARVFFRVASLHESTSVGFRSAVLSAPVCSLVDPGALGRDLWNERGWWPGVPRPGSRSWGGTRKTVGAFPQSRASQPLCTEKAPSRRAFAQRPEPRCPGPRGFVRALLVRGSGQPTTGTGLGRRAPPRQDLLHRLPLLGFPERAAGPSVRAAGPDWLAGLWGRGDRSLAALAAGLLLRGGSARRSRRAVLCR